MCAEELASGALVEVLTEYYAMDEAPADFFAGAWRPDDKSFGFWLQVRQRATTLERTADLSVGCR
jgi:hypothetical protein